MGHSIRLMPRWSIEMTFADGTSRSTEAHGKTGEEAAYHALQSLRPASLPKQWHAVPLTGEKV